MITSTALAVCICMPPVVFAEYDYGKSYCAHQTIIADVDYFDCLDVEIKVYEDIRRFKQYINTISQSDQLKYLGCLHEHQIYSMQAVKKCYQKSVDEK